MDLMAAHTSYVCTKSNFYISLSDKQPESPKQVKQASLHAFLFMNYMHALLAS